MNTVIQQDLHTPLGRALIHFVEALFAGVLAQVAAVAITSPSSLEDLKVYLHTIAIAAVTGLFLTLNRMRTEYVSQSVNPPIAQQTTVETVVK